MVHLVRPQNLDRFSFASGRRFNEDDRERTRHGRSNPAPRLQGLRQGGRVLGHRRPDRPQPVADHRRCRIVGLPAERVHYVSYNLAASFLLCVLQS